MKRYVQLKCSTCARTRESLIDLKYYTTDKCTITLGCEGRLSPVGYTSDGTTLLGVPPTGLTNWYPRATETVDGVVRPAQYVNGTVTSLSTPELYDTGTGTKRQFVLAVSDTSLGYTPNSTATVTLNFVAEQQVAKDYRQYTYRKTGSITTVNGVEDGTAKKVLRYDITGTNPDLVDVYVDGVKRSRGTGANQYQLYDGTVSSPVPPNTVLFNTAITGTLSQIDVVVTKAPTLTTLALTFNRAIDDEARVGTGAWEGVDAVRNQVNHQRWSLFYCDVTELGTLPMDLKLRLDPNTPSTIHNTTTSTLNPAWAVILLSNTKLYTELDRLRAKHVPLSALSSSSATNYLVVKYLDGERQVLLTETMAVDVFPPYEVLRWQAATRRTTGLTGNTEAAVLDNILIVGPDA